MPPSNPTRQLLIDVIAADLDAQGVSNFVATATLVADDLINRNWVLLEGLGARVKFGSVDVPTMILGASQELSVQLDETAFDMNAVLVGGSSLLGSHTVEALSHTTQEVRVRVERTGVVTGPGTILAALPILG